MKKVLICGMLLGLLASVGVAQRGRAGSVGPTVRTMPAAARPMPNAITIPHGGIAPTARVAPNARTSGSATAVAPTTVSPSAKTKVAPNARTGAAETTAPTARTVGPDAQ